VAVGHDRAVDERGVTELLDQLQQAEVLAWLDGGWGVDALLGAQTRLHSDLDLVVARPDLELVQDVLWVLRFEVLRDWLPNAIAYTDLEGRQVDLHPVDPTPDGGGDQIQLDGESRWHYSAPVRGVISGRTVLCCPVEDQVSCHLGYPPRQSDVEDMRRLADRFGLELPEPYTGS
jgi:lincosamide nucleotidyltransferase A/C/D/E